MKYKPGDIVKYKAGSLRYRILGTGTSIRDGRDFYTVRIYYETGYYKEPFIWNKKDGSHDARFSDEFDDKTEIDVMLYRKYKVKKLCL